MHRWFPTLFEANAQLVPHPLRGKGLGGSRPSLGQIQWWLRSVIIGLRIFCNEPVADDSSKEPVADDSGKGPVAGHGVGRPVAVATGGSDAWPLCGALQQRMASM